MKDLFSAWSRVKVTHIALATYVPPGSGSITHQNRLFHGFVLNEPEVVRDYIFADGTILHTGGDDLFYLPKGSTYRTVTLQAGGCYAINFDAVGAVGSVNSVGSVGAVSSINAVGVVGSVNAEIREAPFIMNFRNKEGLFKIFKSAAREWRLQTEISHVFVTKAVYEILCMLYQEQQKQYTPDSVRQLLAPAMEKMEADFTQNGLTVAQLAAHCGISEVYFRRIFLNKFGVSPKEYMINLRINYAKQLLQSGQCSVAQTAELCGYFETSHFSREFSKRVGMSPKEYKSRCGNYGMW